MGAIPLGFSTLEGGFSVAGLELDALLDGRTTPCFVYDPAILRERVAQLRAAMPADLDLHYAMKANPLREVVDWMARNVDGIDVASAGELAIALAAGARAISFAGPGKRNAELEAALRAGIILNIESEGEAERALAIARRLSVSPRLAVRVNPDFHLKASGMRMGGGPAAFGVDAERVPALIRHIAESGASYEGLHIFAGSQNLRADLLIQAQADTVALAARLSREAGLTPPFVNLGGGFGIPYFAGEDELDVEAIGAALGEALRERPPELRDSRFGIELGRWFTGPAGVYLTRVVDVKQSRGRTFVVTDGGLHHQLAATGNFGQVVRRNYPLANVSRWQEMATMEADVVGCLCTPLDRLGEGVMIAPAQVGDVIALFMAGAYGATASPAAFLGHGPAEEVFIDSAL